MRLGIIGLPNVGKSTLFNALSRAGAHVANYPFCTVDPNVGTVIVPDDRLDHIQRLLSLGKKVHATIEFIDIAGLVRGSSEGLGLGNRFLSHIRQTHALLHVVRCFEDGDITHVEGNVNPVRDIHTVNNELLLADLETVERALARVCKISKTHSVKSETEEFYHVLLAHLNSGKPARSFPCTQAHTLDMEELCLLTAKPVIYVSNVNEDEVLTDGPLAETVTAFARKECAGHLKICARLEEELSVLVEGERRQYLEQSGIPRSGLENLILQSYSLLRYISFLTYNEKETRAWTIVNGTTAKQAAGKVHSDMERGFIRAETFSYSDLLSSGSFTRARERGLLRSEGKDYIVRDGDVILFRFHV